MLSHSSQNGFHHQKNNSLVTLIRRIILFTFFFSPILCFTQSIKGKITSPQDEPLEGVNVHLRNSNSGTATDEQGNFELKNVNPGSYRIHVSALGYATKEQEVTVTQDGATVNFQLPETTTQLGDIIVTAQKTEEEIQQLSLSVSVISSARIQ